ncbi:endogenous retrovirus group K member 6 Pro protein-like [Arvicanthis niloticus]|uniref:endogenous retrovirus group K member 6 Pro protein-like n=1 Tax=Arvicanthis niloticus TaxID=61156 RepID=UPI00148744A9|nr:endogenous retrovirus group K member 6 Pro protein-like [Arvicanthis niloticus]
MLLLPSCHDLFPAKTVERGPKGFGSTGTNSIFCSLNLDSRPLIKIFIEEKSISGLLDTSADRSVISIKDWPKGWPKQNSSQMLRGLGYAKEPEMSSRLLHWRDDEGHSGVFQPYVMGLPVSLWGRDLLKEMGYVLTNEKEYSSQSRHIMCGMGYVSGKGLGKRLQG